MVCLSQAAICRYTTDRYEFDPAYGDLNLIVRHLYHLEAILMLIDL